MLRKSELANLRAVAKQFLLDTATIQRRALVDDGNGGKTANFATVATLKCRLAFAGSKGEPTQKDRTEAGRITTQVTFLLTFAHDADVRETDRVVVGNDTYELTSPATVRSQQLSKRFLAKKL